MPRPRDRTRKVRPWRSASCANARIVSKSPAASSSDTRWARPKRCAARSTGPTSLYLDIHRWWRDGFLIADLDGHPVGFLAAVISSDGQARILMFAVSAGWRRRGFGRQIMDAFVQRCAMRGLRRIELEVRISNEEAIRFYKRYGFDVAAVLPKFYTDGEDGFKMVKHF